MTKTTMASLPTFQSHSVTLQSQDHVASFFPNHGNGSNLATPLIPHSSDDSDKMNDHQDPASSPSRLSAPTAARRSSNATRLQPPLSPSFNPNQYQTAKKQPMQLIMQYKCPPRTFDFGNMHEDGTTDMNNDNNKDKDLFDHHDSSNPIHMSDIMDDTHTAATRITTSKSKIAAGKENTPSHHDRTQKTQSTASSVNEDDENVWPEELESVFQEALRAYPSMGRTKIKVEDGKLYGRNELIAKYIYQKTGKLRSRKQVSSHIQVLSKKTRKSTSAPETEMDFSEGTYSQQQGSSSNSLTYPPGLSPIERELPSKHIMSREEIKQQNIETYRAMSSTYPTTPSNTSNSGDVKPLPEVHSGPIKSSRRASEPSITSYPKEFPDLPPSNYSSHRVGSVQPSPSYSSSEEMSSGNCESIPRIPHKYTVSAMPNHKRIKITDTSKTNHETTRSKPQPKPSQQVTPLLDGNVLFDIPKVWYRYFEISVKSYQEDKVVTEPLLEFSSLVFPDHVLPIVPYEQLINQFPNLEEVFYSCSSSIRAYLIKTNIKLKANETITQSCFLESDCQRVLDIITIIYSFGKPLLKFSEVKSSHKDQDAFIVTLENTQLNGFFETFFKEYSNLQSQSDRQTVLENMTIMQIVCDVSQPSMRIPLVITGWTFSNELEHAEFYLISNTTNQTTNMRQHYPGSSSHESIMEE